MVFTMKQQCNVRNDGIIHTIHNVVLVGRYHRLKSYGHCQCPYTKKNCRSAYIHFTDKYKYKYIENVRARARANALAREYNDKVPLI